MGDHEANTEDVEEQCGVIKICVPGIREIPAQRHLRFTLSLPVSQPHLASLSLSQPTS